MRCPGPGSSSPVMHGNIVIIFGVVSVLVELQESMILLLNMVMPQKESGLKSKKIC